MNIYYVLCVMCYYVLCVVCMLVYLYSTCWPISSSSLCVNLCLSTEYPTNKRERQPDFMDIGAKTQVDHKRFVLSAQF